MHLLPLWGGGAWAGASAWAPALCMGVGCGKCTGSYAVHGLSNVAGSGLAVFRSKGLLPMARWWAGLEQGMARWWAGLEQGMARWWAGLEQAGSRIDACSMTVTSVCMRAGA